MGLSRNFRPSKRSLAANRRMPYARYDGRISPLHPSSHSCGKRPIVGASRPSAFQWARAAVPQTKVERDIRPTGQGLAASIMAIFPKPVPDCSFPKPTKSDGETGRPSCRECTKFRDTVGGRRSQLGRRTTPLQNEHVLEHICEYLPLR
jgi:hypothetical protein